MKKSITREQVAFALRQAEGGTPVAEIIRRMTVVANMHISLSHKDMHRNAGAVAASRKGVASK